jgi:CRP/FNR family transcriptional regulator, anaerobic regulatory protein
MLYRMPRTEFKEKPMPLAVAVNGNAVRAAAFPAALHANLCRSCSAHGCGVCAVVKSDRMSHLAHARAPQSVAAGMTFLDEGEPATHFYVLAEGSVKLFKLLPDGRRAIIRFLFPGDLFGIDAGERYVYSAEAMTPASLCRFSRRQLDRMFFEFPGMERQFFKLVTQELAGAQDQMVLLGRKTAHERVASFLLGLDCRAERSGTWLDLPMTRTDIADYLGLTTETVSRVFTVLKDSGCIALAGGRVRVEDVDALTELADGGAVGNDD